MQSLSFEIHWAGAKYTQRFEQAEVMWYLMWLPSENFRVVGRCLQSFLSDLQSHHTHIHILSFTYCRVQILCARLYPEVSNRWMVFNTAFAFCTVIDVESLLALLCWYLGFCCCLRGSLLLFRLLRVLFFLSRSIQCTFRGSLMKQIIPSPNNHSFFWWNFNNLKELWIPSSVSCQKPLKNLTANENIHKMHRCVNPAAMKLQFAAKFRVIV
jgi:hypothetical protein